MLLRFLPPAFDRNSLAWVLTCQVFLGVLLGIAAQFVLAAGVIFYVLPGWASTAPHARCGGVRSTDEGVGVVVGLFDKRYLRAVGGALSSIS